MIQHILLDLITHVRDILSFIWPGAHDKIEQEVCQALGVSSLAHYVNNPDHFFDDHLRRYSKSRRQAPIYWPLSVASGSYTLWLYYHRISDQTCISASRILLSQSVGK